MNYISGLQVIKLEFILRLKIKCNDWPLADTCVRKQPIIVLYFESETGFSTVRTRLSSLYKFGSLGKMFFGQ